jgi:hypothetical protein
MARNVARIQQAKLFSHQSESKRPNMRKRNYMCCTLLGLVIAAPFAFAEEQAPISRGLLDDHEPAPIGPWAG